ncbi:MAG: hypothetical protein K9K93_05675, partial [Acholeplasmataceae bacterium]|nr:hypothetical protein [Acholeplasmataceae bacterium]
MKQLKRIVMGFLVLMIVLLVFSPSRPLQTTDLVEWTDQHNFPAIPIVTPDQAFISYTDFRETVATPSATPLSISTQMAGRTIRFDTALELHRFSLDVSFFEDVFYETGDPV